MDLREPVICRSGVPITVSRRLSLRRLQVGPTGAKRKRHKANAYIRACELE
jgi:hypothetical protein